MADTKSMYRIFIVEDDEIIAGTVKSYLEKWNYTVLCVENSNNVLYFYSANHAPYTYIDVIFWRLLCSFIGIVISIITRKTRKIHPALWISGIISCMLGYLDEITGEYATPEGYLVDEQDAEEFHKKFSKICILEP